MAKKLEGLNPTQEALLMGQVAQEYKLTPEQLRLLYAIRYAENGPVGLEFGVMNDEARRFKDDPIKSFVTQARWAAGTIKKRYTGDLESFAARYAPINAENDPKGLNKNWLPNVKAYMERK